MLLISHRGNLFGPKLERENNVPYINEALEAGFDCEVDVWFHYGKFYLSHDPVNFKKTYDMPDMSFFQNDKLWVHCKNFDALLAFQRTNKVNYFFHDKDAYTLTSKGYVWAFPNMSISHHNKAISVVDKFVELDNLPGYCGVCSDYVGHWKL